MAAAKECARVHPRWPVQSNACSCFRKAKAYDEARRIRGAFIGIDRYEAPEINELRYAERDAVALHALFSDGR
jgi:hypothetical protein